MRRVQVRGYCTDYRDIRKKQAVMGSQCWCLSTTIMHCPHTNSEVIGVIILFDEVTNPSYSLLASNV